MNFFELFINAWESANETTSLSDKFFDILYEILCEFTHWQA